MRYDTDIEPSAEEVVYHAQMHRLYRIIRGRDVPAEALPDVFARQVRRLELAAPPWPEAPEAA